MTAPGGEETFRVVDPTGKVEAAIQFRFEGFTRKHAPVAENEIVGRVSHEARPETGELPGGLRGLVRRLVKQSDWVLTLDGDEVETRQAVAAVLLLIQLQIRGRGGME